MNLKIVAPTFAALLLAGAAHAQTPSPEPACAPGDVNCPAPAIPDETAPLESGRSATGVPAGDADIGLGGPGGPGGMSGKGTPAERNSPAAQQANPLIEPNDQGSSNN